MPFLQTKQRRADRLPPFESHFLAVGFAVVQVGIIHTDVLLSRNLTLPALIVDPRWEFAHNDGSESFRHITTPPDGSSDFGHRPLQLSVYLLHAV